MDPITTAIVAMASAGLTAIGQEACADAYQALKAVIKRKLGLALPKAIEELESDADSQGRRMVLAETVAKSGALQDDETMAAAKKLLEALAAAQKTGATFSIQAEKIEGAIQATRIENLTQHFGKK